MCTCRTDHALLMYWCQTDHIHFAIVSHMYITSKVSLGVTDTLQGRKQYFISETRADALQITLQGNYNILSKGCEKFCIDSHNVILFSIPKSTLEDVLCSPKTMNTCCFHPLNTAAVRLFFSMASQKEGWYCTHFRLYRVQHFKNSLENESCVWF